MKMCCGDPSSILSRIGLLIGLVSLTTLVIAFVSNVWLFTKEPIILPNSNIPTTISFKIGLWRVCPSIKRINISQNLPSPACSLIKYSNWEEIRHSDLGIWAHLDFTPAFITRMRLSTPFEGVSIILMILATFYAVIGHFNSDKKTLVACALYTMAGLSLAGGLFIFASVLSDAFFGHPHHISALSRQLASNYLSMPMPNPAVVPMFDYKYGWSFFAAGAAFIMAEVAAVFTISAYLRRYRSVEEMVSIMVPGGRRKLSQLNINYAKKKVENSNLYKKANTDDSYLEANKGAEDVTLLSKTPPDVCTTSVMGDLGDTRAVGSQEKNSSLEPIDYDENRSISRLISEDVEFHAGNPTSSPKLSENAHTLNEINNENFLIKLNSTADNELNNKLIATTIPIKVKHSNRNYNTLNSRITYSTDRMGSPRNRYCCEEDEDDINMRLKKCDAKCFADQSVINNRYLTLNDGKRLAYAQQARCSQTILDLESPSSSGSSVSCNFSHCSDLNAADTLRGNKNYHRSLPRRKTLQTHPGNKVHAPHENHHKSHGRLLTD